MRQIVNILIIGFLFLSCGHKKTNNSTEDNVILDTVQDAVKQDYKANTAKIDTCDCPNFYKFKSFIDYHTDLVFYDGEEIDSEKNKSDSLFRIYSTDSLCRTIKSIRFSYFDTIPEKFAVFKNVEHIAISSTDNIFGLDMFPNLKSIFFYEVHLDINSSQKWLSRIEGIYAQKAVIKLQTFKATPNLKEIVFSHARLEPFPADFDKLKCLRRITLEAYRVNMDLSEIDLSLNPCLERVEFRTYYNAFSGIPQGLDTNRNFKLIVHHQKLTKEEKEIIKAFNEKNNVNSHKNKKTSNENNHI